MAFSNEYTLKVDIKRRMSNVVPTFKQGDTAILKFLIFDNGKAYDLTSFTSAEITFRTPSGDVVIGNPVLEDGLIVYELTSVEMEKVGIVTVILTLNSGDTNVSIQPFNIFIYDSMKTENLSYIGILQELIAETQQVELNALSVISDMNDTKDALEQDIEDYKTEIDDFNSKRTHLGNWNMTTQYVTNNEVEFNGSTWRALRDNLGVTPAEGLDWNLIARKGDDGTGTVNRVREVFIATEGQTDFTLQQSYDQFQNRIDVTIMGVPQFSPDNFIELTSNSIRLSEGVSAGTEVIVVYYTQSIPMASDIQTTVDNHTITLNNHESRVTNTETNVTSLTEQLADIVTINLKDYGIISDGVTDQTAKLVSIFTTDLIDFEGIILIPFNTKFNITEAFKNSPVNSVIEDKSMINMYKSQTYRQKYLNIGSGDRYENDFLYQIISGHHPALLLNNLGTSGSDSAAKGRGSIMFANGFFEDGTAINTILNQVQNNGSKWMWSLRTLRKYLTPNTVSDTTIMQVDEDGRLGMNGIKSGYDFTFQNNPSDTTQDLKGIVSNNNNDSKARFLVQSKKADGSIVNVALVQNPTGNAAIEKGGQSLLSFSDTSVTFDKGKGLFWKTISGVTPDVTNGVDFTVNNGVATTVTNLVNTGNQEVRLLFANGNTTLKQGNFRLKGGVDWTPTQYSSITLVKTSLTSAWIEVSRTEM